MLEPFAHCTRLVQLNAQEALSGFNRTAALQGRCSKDTNQRSVTVTITDTCPECGNDHIDIQALTFNKVCDQCCVLRCKS